MRTTYEANIMVFWFMIPCSPAVAFGDIHCFHLQEKRLSTTLNVGNHIHGGTTRKTTMWIKINRWPSTISPTPVCVQFENSVKISH